MFPSIEIFGRPFGTYGICALAGIVACWFVGLKMSKKRGLVIYDYAIALITAFLGMMVGAVILYGVTNTHHIINIFKDFGKLCDMIGFWGVMELLVANFSGMVFYGGFIGSCVALLIYTKHSKTVHDKRAEIFDIFAVLVPLFHGFGRIGCFLGGCCYGIECEFGFTAHGNTAVPSVNDVNRFPVQLLESGLNFILFFVLLILFNKRIMEKRLVYIYMLVYPIIRFSDEFLRGDTYRGFLFGLSTSQWVSIILFVFALIMLPIASKKYKRSLQDHENTDLGAA